MALTGTPPPDAPSASLDAPSSSPGASADAPTAPAHGAITGPVRRRALLGSRRRQLLAGAVIAGAIGFLVAQGLGNATQYYKTVPQAVADRASLGRAQFRIMGTVDSDVRQVAGRTQFSISYADVTAQVIDQKEPPQLFKPGVPVVLEGHWAGNVFQSDLIMVKHTAVYNPAEKAVMSTMPGNDTTPSTATPTPDAATATPTPDASTASTPAVPAASK